MNEAENSSMSVPLGAGWCAELLTLAEWRDAITTPPLDRFAEYPLTTPYVYIISKRAPNSQPQPGSAAVKEEEGTFVAPCGVPEDTFEALCVALINAQAHEALEMVQFEGKPYFDPHENVGDYVLERTLTKWLEWKTGKTVVLE